LVKRLRLRWGEKEKGDRRRETVSRKLVWLLGIWDFSHLAVLGELGGLIFQDQEK